MTLIIAGYEHSKSFDYTAYSDDEDATYTPEMESEGLFVVADSAITNPATGRTILNGFRKTHNIEVKLWKPSFLPDGSFSGYRDVYETNHTFVSFAGSTLTAQHIINSITTHLNSLRISFKWHEIDRSIVYTAIRHCQPNPLYTPNQVSQWDDDTFLNRDFEGLLTGELIAETIEYSMNDALKSASKYKLDLEEFRAMHTEIVAGVWCPVRRRHELYLYRMECQPGDDGVLVPFTTKALVPTNKVAVLGMKQEFESEAQQAFSDALSSFISPANTMLDFLRTSIRSVEDKGQKGIAFPMSISTLDRYRIKKRTYQE
ncbi:hypothetical protein [Pseudomonas helleri]|uniref:Uncharacterized protein n=1 Tax=Pseudomonas helleri TaxID=1608996 RepID=A0A7X2CG43_9PSED|nr:hypothetical protein [Pseudomonas helleri]MQT93051.1 hypothetical protein [Pseudomonas helleri]MQU29823.1 hypothetical protein [Pseudomonas helleri]